MPDSARVAERRCHHGQAKAPCYMEAAQLCQLPIRSAHLYPFKQATPCAEIPSRPHHATGCHVLSCAAV